MNILILNGGPSGGRGGTCRDDQGNGRERIAGQGVERDGL